MDGVDKIIEAGGLIGNAKTAPGGIIPYAVVPESARVEDLEHLLPAPTRVSGNVTAKSVDTFCVYTNRYKTENTAIFGDHQGFILIGIIDYHPVAAAAWASHRLTYEAPRSIEWETWTGSNKKTMAQADFAQFIEDNVVDIRSPAGAAVLEVARGLQAKKSVQFASAIRLSDGAQEFTYSETIDGTTSKGKVRIPEEFSLGIPVFFGGPAYEVRARLRYRIKDGALSLWYDLYRPEHIEKDAFGAICAEVAEKTSIAVWQGTP